MKNTKGAKYDKRVDEKLILRERKNTVSFV
jgi:hypothetical protein